mmetsp:Transcript_6161/g.24641  ORF Transcript_6161/g.24641 Transcript_6161/m.24641 type:complete len:696 (-) Transcript_6161:121-2208(-)
MARLRLLVAEGEEVVGQVGRAGKLGRTREAQRQQVQHQAVVLRHEARELQAADEAVRVRVAHVLVRYDDVVLGRDVVGDVVVDDEPQQAVEHRQVHLLVQLLELGLQDDQALALRGLPHVREVVDALAPLVHEERGRLGVGGFHPVGKEVPLVGLVPEVRVQVRVGDLLERFDLVHGHQVAVHVHELQAHLLEGALREQVALDAAECLVRVVVRLLDEAQLLALVLVEANGEAVDLLEALERQNEQLGIVLVAERREGDRRELAALEPVHGGGVDGHRLLGRHVRAVLQVVVLALLLRLQPQARQAAKVLLAHRLVDRRATPDALTVVVRDVGPPVALRLDVPQDHVLHWRRQAGHLPRNVGLPASPRLGEVHQDGARFVLLDALGHHVQDVVHDGRAQLQVEVRLHALLRDRLGDALGVAALKLARQQVAQPALEQRDDAAQEEQPHAPRRRPEAHAGALAHWPGVKAVVDEVLEVLAHADLAHHAVLVAVHARQLAHVSERVLQAVGQLEGVDVAEAELHVGVDNQLGEAQHLATQVEGVPEAALLPLLGREGLDRLEVEVVVQVQVVEVLAVDEQVQHVVALPAHLQAHLHPVHGGLLEEFGRLERLEERALLARRRGPAVQLVEHVALEQLLVRHADLHGVPRGAVLLVPRAHERHVDRAARAPRAQVEGARREEERYAHGRRVSLHRTIG